jgi:hypothetical protein
MEYEKTWQNAHIADIYNAVDVWKRKRKERKDIAVNVIELAL